MKQQYLFDCFSQQALQTLHRYRAVMLVLPSVLCKLQFEILFSHFLHLHNSDSYGQTISTDPYRSTGLGT